MRNVEAILRDESIWLEGELRNLGFHGAVVCTRRKLKPGKADRIEFVAELPGSPSKIFGSGFVSLVTLQTHGHWIAREATLELIEQVKEELNERLSAASAVQ